MSDFLVKFKPAQYYSGKESYVGYYVVNPFTNKMVRKKIKLNHIANSKERKRYALRLAFEINAKLYDGWNPFTDESTTNSKKLLVSVNLFLADKSMTLRPDSMRCYRSYAKIFVEWCTTTGLLDQYCFSFEKSHAERFLKSMEHKGITNKSYNNYVAFFFTLFSYFIDRGWCSNNPFDGIRRKRVDRKTRTTISADDRKRIIGYFEQHDLHGYVVLMRLCFQCLIRPKEMLMLKLSDVDVDNGLISIRSDVAKNHHQRDVAIPDDLIPYFRDFSDLDNHFYVFSSKYVPGKKMLSSRDSARTWSVMRKELHLPKEYQFYSLKDTGITEMLEAGVAPKYVKELADHHSLEMTEKYTHRSNAKKIMEATKLDF